MTEPDATGAATPLEPVTERILRALGGRRSIWILLWAAIPLVAPFVFSTAVGATRQPIDTAAFFALLWTQGTIAWALLVTLWGCGRLARDARSTRDELVRAAPDHIPDRLFGAISRTDGPAALTGVVVAIIVESNSAQYGLIGPLATVPLTIGYMLPIITFIWVYVAILTDINRLGELPVVLDRFPHDRTMGLASVGSLASTGLGVLFVAAVPVILVGAGDPLTFAISLTLVLGVIAIYALSMWRLHRQMATAKKGYVATARQLYDDAYAPIRERPDLETLAASSSALSVAQSLDERAAGLPTWPIDEGTARFVAVIITGVLTSLIVRAVFAAIGV